MRIFGTPPAIRWRLHPRRKPSKGDLIRKVQASQAVLQDLDQKAKAATERLRALNAEREAEQRRRNSGVVGFLRRTFNRLRLRGA